MNRLNQKILRNPSLFRSIIIVFYFVGILGINYNLTHNLFIRLTPIALLFTFGVLIYHHDVKWKIKHIVAIIIIYLLTFSIEAIGVKTGIVFGSYVYHTALGIKLFDTPLLIGINWLMVALAFNSITLKLKTSRVFSIITTSVAMVLYDIVLENVAPILQMWHWESSIVPIQNYIAWFLVSLIVNSILHYAQLVKRNPLSTTIIISQVLYFISVLI